MQLSPIAALRADRLVALLAFLTILNIAGLGVGKWLNISARSEPSSPAAVLIGLGIVNLLALRATSTAADSRFLRIRRFVLNSFASFALAWSASNCIRDGRAWKSRILGDPARRRRLGRAVSGALYVGADPPPCSLRGRKNVNVLQGSFRPSPHGGRVGIGWITAPFALMLSVSIAGIGSAWMGGSAASPLSPASIPTCLPGSQSSPALRHLRRAHRSRPRLNPAGGGKFLWLVALGQAHGTFGLALGWYLDPAVPQRCSRSCCPWRRSPTCSFSLHVRGPGEVRRARTTPSWALRQRHTFPGGNERLATRFLGSRSCSFGATKSIRCGRMNCGWVAHPVFRRAGSFFLFCGTAVANRRPPVLQVATDLVVPAVEARD